MTVIRTILRTMFITDFHCSPTLSEHPLSGEASYNLDAMPTFGLPS